MLLFLISPPLKPQMLHTCLPHSCGNALDKCACILTRQACTHTYAHRYNSVQQCEAMLLLGQPWHNPPYFKPTTKLKNLQNCVTDVFTGFVVQCLSEWQWSVSKKCNYCPSFLTNLQAFLLKCKFLHTFFLYFTAIIIPFINK